MPGIGTSLVFCQPAGTFRLMPCVAIGTDGAVLVFAAAVLAAGVAVGVGLSPPPPPLRAITAMMITTRAVPAITAGSSQRGRPEGSPAAAFFGLRGGSGGSAVGIIVSLGSSGAAGGGV